MKAMQKCDISMNTIKNNYIFSDFAFPNFNGIVLTSLFQEQLKYADVKPYFLSILSQHQCLFRKGFSLLTTLIPMIESWRASLDSGGNFGALFYLSNLSDLSKAFDCLSHDFLLAKLLAYGLDMSSLNPLHCYSTKKRQKIKIKNTYSSCS